MTLVHPTLLPRAALVLAPALWLGCGPYRIDDRPLEALGEEVGAASTALITTTADAEAEALRAHVERVGDALVDLVIAHDAWSGEGGELSALVEGPVALPADEILVWDGAALEANFTTRDGDTARVYDVSLGLVTGRRNGEVDSQFPGLNGADLSGVDEIRGVPTVLPPFIDDTFVLSSTAVVDGVPHEIRLHAAYVQLTLDGEACAAGGGVDISYAIETPDGTRGGFVRAGYHGCGRVFVYRW